MEIHYHLMKIPSSAIVIKYLFINRISSSLADRFGREYIGTDYKKGRLGRR